MAIEIFAHVQTTVHNCLDGDSVKDVFFWNLSCEDVLVLQPLALSISICPDKIFCMIVDLLLRVRHKDKSYPNMSWVL
jgi:hypothetical protein